VGRQSNPIVGVIDEMVQFATDHGRPVCSDWGVRVGGSMMDHIDRFSRHDGLR